MRAVIIHLRPPLPTAWCGLPADIERAARLLEPVSRLTWPCSGWGLPSHASHLACWWSLTPPFHPYQDRSWRFAFCGTVPRVTPGGRYPPPCPVESGLSSIGVTPTAITQPTRPRRWYALRVRGSQRRDQAPRWGEGQYGGQVGSPAYDRWWGVFVNGVTRGHRVVNRLTGGRMEIRLPRGGRGIWITTTGRRTGQPRRTPLLSVQDDSASLGEHPAVWIIAGSNGGQERLPAWVHNARAHPVGVIEVARRSWPVRFDEVTGAEHERCYAQLAVPWPMYRSYARHAGRPIPVFRCVPLTAEDS